MNLVDLSHPLSNKTPTYPTDPDISIVRLKEIQKHNSVLHYVKMGTHTGTHLDAPSHIIPDGKTLNNVSLNRFTGDCN